MGNRELNELVESHITDSRDYIEIVDKLTSEQTKTLDDLIQKIVTLTKQPDYILDINELQDYYLRLSSELYIMLDKLKQFEIYASLAKSNETESYNNAYLEESTTQDGTKKPAVAELQIRASNKTKRQSLVNVVYASAFKSIKSKIESGNNVADTLKNIIKAKTTLEYTTNQSNNRGAF